MEYSEADVRRTFLVTKDDDSKWDMVFTTRGVDWRQRPDGVDARLASTDPVIDPPTPGSFGGLKPLGVILDVARIAADVWATYEVRQQRLLEDANREEGRRLVWLSDMVSRWAAIHQGGGQLDLRISEYLAREARATMDATLNNRKIAIPQSLLYELDAIGDSMRNFRGLMKLQFEALAASPAIDFSGALSEVMPHTRLNEGFVHQLASDPAVEWDERIAAKTTADFDVEFTDLLRQPRIFANKLFATTEVEVFDATRAGSKAGTVQRLIGLMTSALPRFDMPDYKSDAWERRDMYRELSLIPAEVSRVKALNTAWLAVSDIVEEAHGRPLEVELTADGVGMYLGNRRPIGIEANQDSRRTL